MLWTGAVAGIDKTSKGKKTNKAKVNVIEEEQKAGKTDSQQGIIEIDQSRSKKAYDDFIDNNNNGIDDRAEKKVITKKTKKEKSGSQQTGEKRKK
jgi:hypothetical protein